jgi:hypothetical protein
LLIQDGEFHSTAPTSRLGPLIDDAQLLTGEGPCLDAAGPEAVTRCDDLSVDPRWPAFAPTAVAAGVLSVLSFHLYTHGANTGALNLFSSKAQAFDHESEVVGAMLATHAATALIAANWGHQLESALVSRDIIGQAKGIIMERYDLDDVGAFDMMRRLSQETNTTLVEIARRVIGTRGDR